MVHHPMSCSQNSRYLHSGSSNFIDFAEGVGLFFFSAAERKCYSIIKVLHLMTVLSLMAQ